MAIHRRHAARLDLGPRRLCRARLERRLAAPRSASRSSTSGRSAKRARRLRRRCSEEQQAALRGRLATRMRDEHVRPANRHDHARRRPRGRDRSGRGALRVPVRQRSGDRRAARSLRDEKRHGAGRRAPARRSRRSSGGPPGRRRPSGPGAADHLHQQLARASRWSATGRRRARICGPPSACCSCSPGSRCSAGTTR